MTREQEIAELRRIGDTSNWDILADVAYLLAENARLRGLAAPVDVEAIRVRVADWCNIIKSDDGGPTVWLAEDIAALLGEVNRLRQLCGLLLNDNPDDRVTACRYETALECAEMAVEQKRKETANIKSTLFLSYAASVAGRIELAIRCRFGLPLGGMERDH